MQSPGTKLIKVAPFGLAFLSLLSCWSTLAAGPLTSVDDSAATLPDTPIVISVLMNDAVATGNSTAILRVTQPSHGRVIRNSTPTSHAELTPLFQFAATQLSNTVAQVVITNLYPWYLTNGVWRSIPTNTAVNFDQNWIGGFFPGSLWMIYEQTGDPNFSHWAQMWQAALAPEQYSTAKDDVGFLINSSFGNGYRITGNPQYKDILTQTRRSFTNRWNAVVGCLADDRLLTPPPFEVLVDTMMNTEIFYRADLDRDTAMLAMANSHAGRTLTNHLRADGSTYMRVIYDGVTNGSVLVKDNRVPIGALDTWARGQAWATHAFPLLYGSTGDGRFLETAKRVADFYISHAPADYVPYWYYPSGGMDTTLLRDSSAGAVTLSGLLDLSQQVSTDSDGAKYWLAAHRLFASLSSPNYLAVNTTNAILLHANPVDANTDTSVIYGDYYFIESLKRFNDLFNQTTLTYSPAANFTGTDSFTYQACDSSGAVSTATVTVTVGSGSQVYTVAVSASPVAGGSANGGGTFAPGNSVTVTATANPGYQFASWTEGATVVSSLASYTFPITGNRTLVANFTPSVYTVALSASPGAGGNASGGGTFAPGSSVTVTATANPGYQFASWTEGATVVSSLASYTFTLNGNRTLVANFTGTGSLQVSISPGAAVKAGAQWQVDGGTWHKSGATVSGLSVAGGHSVAFKAVSGWATPANQAVAINANQTTATTGTYLQTGSLQVSIAPAGAVNAGALWQVDSGAWQNSGTTISGLPVGSHTVAFKAISGWTTPLSRTATINANNTTSVTGTYLPDDTTPPTVDLTSPAAQATVSGTLALAADAGDNVGVVKVEFYFDTALVGTDTTAPFSVTFDTTTVPNGAHSVYCIAYDAAGNSTASASRALAVSNTVSPPVPPTSLSATAGNRRIDLKWTQSTSPGITQNKVYRSTAANGPYSVIATLSATTSFSNTGLTRSSTYYYVVTVLNSGGESGYSNYAGASSK